MANVFDQFDTQQNVFDQFDAPAQAIAAPEVQAPSAFKIFGQDTTFSLGEVSLEDLQARSIGGGTSFVDIPGVSDQVRVRFSEGGNAAIISPPERARVARELSGINIKAPSSFARKKRLGPATVGTTIAAAEKTFGKKVSSVEKDPISGRNVIVFESGDRAFENEPGLSFGEALAIGPQILEVGSEIAAGLIGLAGGGKAVQVAKKIPGLKFLSKFVPVTGAIGLEGLMMKVNLTARLKQGRDEGINNMSDEEIDDFSTKQAALMSGFNAVAFAGTAIGKGLMTPGGRFLSGFDEVQFLKDLESSKLLQKEIKERTGQDFPQSVGDVVTGPKGDVIRSAESEIIAADPLGPLAGVAGARQAAIDTTVEDVLPGAFRGAGKGQSRQATGARLQQEAQAPAVAQEAESAQRVAAQSEAFQRETEEFAAKGLNREVAGNSLQEAVQGTKTSVSESFKPRYDEIDELTQGVKLNARPLRVAAARHKKALDKDLFPSLADEDRKIIQEALRVGTRTTEIPAQKLVAATIPGRQITEEVPITLGQVSRSLSVLKAERRAVAKGISPGAEIKVYDDLIDSLTKMQDEALAAIPDKNVAALVTATNRDYAQFKQSFDREFIGKMLFKEEGGRYRMSGDRVIKTLMSDPRNMRETFVSIDKYVPEPETAKRVIRRGIIDEYERAPSKASWVARNKDVLDVAFGGTKERGIFDRTASFAGTLKKTEKQEQRLVAAISKTSEGIIRGWKPGQVVKQVMNPDNIEDVAKWRATAGGYDSQTWKEVQEAGHELLMAKVAPAGTASKQALDHIFSTAGTQDKKLIGEVFGPQYVKDLDLIRRMVTESAKKQTFKVGPPAFSLGRQVAEGIARVSVAPPLSRGGRAFTAAKGLELATAGKRLQRAVMSPDKLRKFIKLRHTTNRSAIASFLAVDLGMSADDIAATLGEEFRQE